MAKIYLGNGIAKNLGRGGVGWPNHFSGVANNFYTRYQITSHQSEILHSLVFEQSSKRIAIIHRVVELISGVNESLWIQMLGAVC